ncbi:MAG: 50S ribosomal protein L6 [Candidatus Pacearchaeota archaeon]
MKQKISEQLEIPNGISCEFSNNILKCKKDSSELTKKIDVPGMSLSIKDNKIFIECESGNKKDFKKIKSYVAHIKNLFYGLQKEYIYRLESCNVHFPMTLKIDGDNVVITNFLGEKTPRFAKILPGVKVEIKGQKITVSSPNKEAAGHTASNLERATKIKNRDRRIFQDGIFIVERPGGAK